jgi:hydroxypyruvate isomerase
MQRKSFIQKSLLAGSSLLAAGAAAAYPKKRGAAAGQPFNLNYGFHDGMFRNSGGNDFIDQLQFGYDQGFRAIEDNGMAKRPVEQQQKIGDTLTKFNCIGQAGIPRHLPKRLPAGCRRIQTMQR